MYLIDKNMQQLFTLCIKYKVKKGVIKNEE